MDITYWSIHSSSKRLRDGWGVPCYNKSIIFFTPISFDIIACYNPCFPFKSESCKEYNPLSEHHHSEEQLTQQIQKANIKFHLPQIKITQYKLPKIVIVLENSVRMNGEDQWKFIRTACKKLILHDLPENAEVGLVTFNEDANISHAIGNSNYLIARKF